jgi:hypothetical protein
MIGVIANSADHEIVKEFFELFKTPWEQYRRGRDYDVLLCTDDDNLSEFKSKLVFAYSGGKRTHEHGDDVLVSSKPAGVSTMIYKGMTIPIYGRHAAFRRNGLDVLTEEESGESTGYIERCGEVTRVRIGYDLFEEIRILLERGQPVENASIPTLDLHVTLLRDLIIGCGISLVEIPPVPNGYRFIACLTHDVDHPSIRRHKCDHTMFGFLNRAVFGSAIDLIRGRASFRHLLTNWTAALGLPFVYLGLARDLWSEFDVYAKLEGGASSTFFVIPFRGRPGSRDDGPAPSRRSSAYGIEDIATEIERLTTAGCEIGVHGVDAWRDTASAQEEVKRVQFITGTQDIGIRMHWLYFDEKSPSILETAGVSYDSTIGYNETVGFRAGTAQAYKPLGTTRLLELPLIVMDTALFFPAHLNLAYSEAWKLISRLIETVADHGGCLTLNWHDRSISPERLWGDFYVALIDELKKQGAWMASGAQAVSWFRKRRSATFDEVHEEQGGVKATIRSNTDERLPALQLLTYQPRLSGDDSMDRGEKSSSVRDSFLQRSVTRLSESVCVTALTANTAGNCLQ